MFTKSKYILTALITLSLLVLSSCSSVPKKWETKDWKFDTIVDVQYVKKMVSVPMKKDKFIIDSRPFMTKYIKGHIPGAISLPYSKFDKLMHLLPENKDAELLFYCGGVKCSLSHKSAWKARYHGYTNVKVFATGFPSWMKKKGNYASVDTVWVNKMIGSKKKVVFIDSRPKRPKYDKGHITNAISIPNTKFAKLKRKLPRGKKTTLVFYCGGFKCKLSHKSASKAIKLGYKNVKVYAAGYPAWKKVSQAGNIAVKAGAEEGSIDQKTFMKLVKSNSPQLLVIDVRDKPEYDEAHIKNAINIPVEHLEERISEIPGNKTVVFTCSTGARSGEAYYMMQDLKPKMKKIYYLDATITIAKDGTFKID
jgi:rhodanese-related sulfurtransferase